MNMNNQEDYLERLELCACRLEQIPLEGLAA